jgi:AHBA synthesis associated protein
MTHSEIRSVIFDLDGVLIDSLGVMEVAYHSACRAVLRNQSYPPFSEYCKYLGRSLPEIIRILELPYEICDSYVMVSYELIDTIQMYTGVQTMLRALQRQGIPMCVATGKDRERTLVILRNLGILDFFDIVMCSEQVCNPKPAPDMANHIIQTLNWSPANTLFVGDAEADILCGKAAGTQTALAIWGNPDKTALRHQTTYRLGAPKDLLDLALAPLLIETK